MNIVNKRIDRCLDVFDHQSCPGSQTFSRSQTESRFVFNYAMSQFVLFISLKIKRIVKYNRLEHSRSWVTRQPTKPCLRFLKSYTRVWAFRTFLGSIKWSIKLTRFSKFYLFISRTRTIIKGLYVVYLSTTQLGWKSRSTKDEIQNTNQLFFATICQPSSI